MQLLVTKAEGSPAICLLTFNLFEEKFLSGGRELARFILILEALCFYGGVKVFHQLIFLNTRLIFIGQKFKFRFMGACSFLFSLLHRLMVLYVLENGPIAVTDWLRSVFFHDFVQVAVANFLELSLGYLLLLVQQLAKSLHPPETLQRGFLGFEVPSLHLLGIQLVEAQILQLLPLLPTTSSCVLLQLLEVPKIQLPPAVLHHGLVVFNIVLTNQIDQHLNLKAAWRTISYFGDLGFEDRQRQGRRRCSRWEHRLRLELGYGLSGPIALGNRADGHPWRKGLH